RILGHFGIEVVHQHAQRRFGRPRLARALAAARRALRTSRDVVVAREMARRALGLGRHRAASLALETWTLRARVVGMKVFVPGATGFIGGAVASALARAGHAVVGSTRSAEKTRALEALEVEPLVGNLDDSKLLVAAVQRCEVLVHCAAEYSP